MDIEKATHCNAEMTYVPEEKHFRPYHIPSPAHSLRVNHNSFLVGPRTLENPYNCFLPPWKACDLALSMIGSFSHIRSQLKCYFLSKTLFVIQVYKSLLPQLVSMTPCYTLQSTYICLLVYYLYIPPKTVNPMRIVVSLDHCCIPRPQSHARHIVGFYKSLQNKWKKLQGNCFSTRK